MSALDSTPLESGRAPINGIRRHLRVETADILGFSNGASVALQVAIRHPQLVRRMVFASSMTKRAGARPELWEFELTRLISGARLLILPAGHGDYLGEAVMTQTQTRYPELIAQLIEDCLDADSAAHHQGR